MPGLDRNEIHEGHKRGLLTSQEKLVLLRREDGWNFQHIADEYGYTQQYAAEVAQRAGGILRSGKRPRLKRPPKPMPDEYVIKLTRRQRDSLKAEDLKTMIKEVGAKSHPCWAHALMALLDQVLDQNMESHGWRARYDPHYNPVKRHESAKQKSSEEDNRPNRPHQL